MQFHKVMEPVFALLGVTLKTRNLAQPAGIMPSGMGAKDIFGKEVDVIIWDGSPTENDNAGVQDLVFRQALLSGNRVPFVLGGPLGRLQLLHEQVGADVGQYGQALEGLPVCTSQKQSKTVPYAARCRICEGPKKADWCGSKFQANCWIPRNDVTPTRKQRPHPDGQVEANPGWKWHQAVGRSIAFMILRAIKEGLTQWQAAGKPVFLPNCNARIYQDEKVFHLPLCVCVCIDRELCVARQCLACAPTLPGRT